MTLPRLTSALIPAPHGFFTRAGGISTGGYASLNASLSGGDDRNAVLENRARIAAALGITSENLLGLSQIHGPDVITVTAAWPTGHGPRADAMVTNRPGIALGIITADCAPVLFMDAAAGIVGAAHAGWRGAAAGILEATLHAMRALGATTITAVIGPCIQQPSYEVGPDMRDEILAATPTAVPCFTPGATGKFQFDLPAYCTHRLTQAGAAAAALQADTYADAETFFSHRRRTHAGGGAIGHQMSVIRL